MKHDSHTEQSDDDNMEELRAVMRQIETVQHSMKRIETAISGDRDVGQLGLVSRVAAIEEMLEEHSRKFFAVHVLYGVGGAILGLIAAFYKAFAR